MPRASAARRAAAADVFAGGGEMGALMRATDWSATGLGPVEHWPQSLRTMLGVVLGSRFPMLLWWGPNLLHLYNDAYRPILRDKHPASLGAPAALVWAEVWEVAGPLARGVLDGGPATWTEDLQLFIASGAMTEETYFTFSYSPVPGDDGRVGGILNTVQETTAKVQSQRQIRMLHDLSARAAEARTEGDARRIVLEVLSANDLDFPFVHLLGPTEASDAWPVQEAAWRGRPVVVEDRAVVLPVFGRESPAAFLVAGVSPHRKLDDAYLRLFTATADQVGSILANVRAYEAETRRAEELTAVDRAKTAFFSNVSHEFRTPLTLILGPVEEALARPDGALAGENLAAVHRSAERLLRLVNSLLDFARMEAGRLQVAFVPTDLAGLTADVAGTFRSLVETAGLGFTASCPPLDAPVYVDPAHWEKIVLNLLSNAFKFTLSGEIAVTLRDEAENVVLAVRDTGTGIPEAEVPNLFLRFHRVQGAVGRSFEGTGIGLSMVHELVKLHGGSVRVESAVGQGSTFFVTVPKGRAHLPADKVQSDAPALRAPGPYLLEAAQWTPAAEELPVIAGPKSAARVLVADDNADMREYLSRLLGTRWSVEVAGDGRAALLAAVSRPPDIVVSDVMMPVLDGIGLLRELRARLETRDIPVILLSARAGEEAVVEGLDTGADDYLVKPFAARELLARVNSHLEIHRTRREWALELKRANDELEAFSYSVSHDLRAPLRAVDGFSEALLADHADQLDERGRHYLNRVRAGAERMGQLIDDLLKLSRVSRVDVEHEDVDLSDLARLVLTELSSREPSRRVEWRVADAMQVRTDARLLRVLLENLLGNAYKFTSKREGAQVEVGMLDAGTFFVRDNGVGFDPEFAGRLFAPFARLHPAGDFEGSGIGLAIVQRIVNRHRGRVWAESAPGKGATFYFTLA